ncbi:quinolinate synthetase complex, A subunit [Afipia carboxidovorans OM5]|uniref:Quinolinate synthase n=1 Tax=Afipia carboxidovorans (strain ATCC 49405 / DSM 1227 / KCTC 32145 / OM5) TaxID=504832 RepID=B6JEU5_AFIC5|nr:quinolinate synthase NadA [Afipia carboxidovorans]ACI94050.1 quinolinate synthetase complex, A subunit [Afipia carboxidovorans OM5]AEI02285.1 quinolinate synthase A [Afipia carboxidovorans OM4]AEI05861.1 quinolinate synthase A [Afipia carboxidovorans OM5]BEV46646.1 quinolinate synthase NadA [Afipia carboxidovorans]
MPLTGLFGPEDFGTPALARNTDAPRCDARERFTSLPTPALEWTPEVERATAHLYERVKEVIPPVEWPFMAPYIKAINDLKRERNAVILAHNYQTPEIFHCVGDVGGDSLKLAIEATKVKADVIVQCGVHFMAETSKILNPSKTVLIPDSRAGCSLASSITGEDVRLLRERFPGVPVVAYVNTSADVKAEVDICCTSSNAVAVVESLGVDTVIMVPDQYLAKYVATKTKVKIIAWKGACEVHERFTGDELRSYRAADPDVQIIAHPECPPDVINEADFTGSTAHMIDWVRNNKPKRVVMVTECSMADNVQAELPEVNFVKPCNLCPHMKRITLPKILDSLLYMREEIVIDPMIADKARRSVERMVNLKN